MTAGVPVVELDPRRSAHPDCTAFVGGDNFKIPQSQTENRPRCVILVVRAEGQLP
jgi:hypothetical protein